MRFIVVGVLVLSLLTLFGCGTTSKTIAVSQPGSNSAEPAVATDSKGDIYVLYVEHGEDKAADVYLQKFNRELLALGERTRVNPEVGRATAWRGDPPTIVVGSDGTVYVGWTVRIEAPKGAATDLYLSTSHDGGQSFEPPVKVNDDTLPASHGMHSLAVDNTGTVVFAWLDERYLHSKPEVPHSEQQMAENMPMQHQEPNGEVYYSVSTDKGGTFAPNKKVAGEACPCCKTALVAASDGKIYLSWRQVLPGDLRHIAVASSGDGGNSFSEPAIVSDDQWQIHACPVSGPALAIGKDNVLEVAWYTAGQAGATGLYTSKSSDGGKTFSPRQLIDSAAVSGNPVLLSAGTVWGSLGNLFAWKENPGVKGLGAGDFPAAALSERKLYTAYVKEEGGRKSVYLSEFAN